MKKQNHKAPHIPRYNLSLAEINAMAMAVLEKERKKLTDDISNLLLICMVETLTVETKFEPKRLQKVARHFENIVGCYADKFVDIEEMRAELNRKYEINL